MTYTLDAFVKDAQAALKDTTDRPAASRCACCWRSC